MAGFGPSDNRARRLPAGSAGQLSQPETYVSHMGGSREQLAAFDPAYSAFDPHNAAANKALVGTQHAAYLADPRRQYRAALQAGTYTPPTAREGFAAVAPGLARERATAHAGIVQANQSGQPIPEFRSAILDATTALGDTMTHGERVATNRAREGGGFSAVAPGFQPPSVSPAGTAPPSGSRPALGPAGMTGPKPPPATAGFGNVRRTGLRTSFGMTGR